jgi:hypothetical protein
MPEYRATFPNTRRHSRMAAARSGCVTLLVPKVMCLLTANQGWDHSTAVPAPIRFRLV